MFVSRIFGSSLILRNRKPFLHYLNSERNLQFPKPVLARAQGPGPSTISASGPIHRRRRLLPPIFRLLHARKRLGRSRSLSLRLPLPLKRVPWPHLPEVIVYLALPRHGSALVSSATVDSRATSSSHPYLIQLVAYC